MAFITFFVISLSLFASKSAHFYNGDDTYEQHFGTKTPYRVVANENDSEVQFPGCTPVKIWYVIRHGTRTPTERLLKEMRKHLPGVLNRIIEANERNPDINIKALKKWKLEYNETVLTEEGAKEHQLLAKRMQKRFPTLFPTTFSNDTYLFRHTNTQRTMASAKNFSLGLFGNEDFENVYIPPPITLDPVLRYYRICKRWKVEVEDKHAKQQKLFHESYPMMEQIEVMSKALNLTRRLSVDEVNAMFQTCCIEAANNKKSVWCSLIPMDMIKIMEFSQTLLYDHKHGYVNEISYKQACPMLQHMIQFFDSPENLTTTVMFTHDSAVLPFMSHLGLFKNDRILEHTDFNSDFDNKWKLSEIGTFASNIAFVLFSCLDELKVGVFHQERLVQLPNCEELCDFEDLKDYYYDSIYHCELNEICSN